MPYKDSERARTRSAAYRASHQEQLKSYDVAYKAAHKSPAKARRAAYRVDHLEQLKTRDAAYRAAHRDEVKARHTAYRAAHLDEIKQSQTIYRVAHLEEKRAYDVKYRKAHRAQQKAYRKAHLEARQTANARRRAKKRGLAATLTREQWGVILEAYQHKCAYCGKKENKKRPLTKDHVIPIKRGGGTTLNNIVPACLSCNAQKSIKLPAMPVQLVLT